MTGTWEDLSDDELRARLLSGSELWRGTIEELVDHRDDPRTAEIITDILGDE